MIKKNLFVHIQCQGLAITSYLHSPAPAIPIIAHRSRTGREPEFKANTLPMPVMRIRMVLDSAFLPRSKARMRAAQYTDVVVLRADLEKFCNFFDAERVRWDQDTEIEVEVNPSTNDGHHLASISQRFFTREIQEILLAPIKHGLRACPVDAFKVKGCSEEDLVTETTQEVSEHRRLDSIAQAEIRDLEKESEISWRNGDLLDCKRHCTAGIAITLRFLAIYSATPSFTESIETPLDDLRQCCFTFHLLLARCLLADLTNTPAEEYLHSQKTCEALSKAIDDAQTLKFKGSRAFNTVGWWPSNHEDAEMWYMKAKALRLVHERSGLCNVNFGFQEIQQAIELCPNDAVFQEEEELIDAFWEDQRERREKSREDRHQAIEKATEAGGFKKGDELDVVIQACMSLDME